MVISTIIAPPSAPQILPYTPAPPRSPILTGIDKRIIEAVRVHGVAKLWPLLDDLARQEGVTGRENRRNRRRELYTEVHQLIRAGALIGTGRNCIALPGQPQPAPARRRPPVASRRPRRTGSATQLTASPAAAELANPPQNHLVAPNTPPVHQLATAIQTKSAVTQEQISEAARSVAKLPRNQSRRWTGWIDGQRCWRGRLVLTPAGDVLPLLMANRGRVLLQEISDQDLPVIEIWLRTVWRSEEVKIAKHPAAVLLGKRKRGIVERPSEAKQRAARQNGVRPCRPGRHRGRPARNQSTI